VSCGGHHETPCEEVLQRAYEYIDGELGQLDYAKVKVHLAECIGCLDEIDHDVLVKQLVRRSCSESAPEELRTRILATITTLRIEYDA
jgi:mycothiol system anti-sigma-R factor